MICSKYCNFKGMIRQKIIRTIPQNVLFQGQSCPKTLYSNFHFRQRLRQIHQIERQVDSLPYQTNYTKDYNSTYHANVTLLHVLIHETASTISTDCLVIKG